MRMSGIDSKTIDALLSAATASGTVPGVVAAAADANGLIYQGASGVRALGLDTLMTTDSVMWIASMTKAITGTCAMQLVEQGKLNLDGPISDVLPQLADVQVLEGFDDDGSPRLRKARTPITLRHLLTHTSGFGYDMWNADLGRYIKHAGIPRLTSGKAAALMQPLTFEPGTQWQYGIGIDWAGRAVEAASGQTLGAYMKTHVFDPLQMHDTAFRIGAAQRKRLAKVHARSDDGLFATDTEVVQEPEFEGGGGGLYSTMPDYLRFTRMILNNGMLDGARVLKPETVTLMAQNAMGDLSCSIMHSALPRQTNTVDFVDGMTWGLTFLINPKPMKTGRSAGSLAWAGLANSYYWIDPVRQVTGVFATQILPFYDAKAHELFSAFESEIYRGL